MDRLFFSPIGEPRSTVIWPTPWFDANPFGSKYELPSRKLAYHTGADLNKNLPQWDSDNNEPVYSIGDGYVTFASELPTWGKVIVIAHENEHGNIICSRYAHLRNVYVAEGQIIDACARIGTIGGSQVGCANHLHFDVSFTEVLTINPGHWPGLNYPSLRQNYLDPLAFLRYHVPDMREVE